MSGIFHRFAVVRTESDVFHIADTKTEVHLVSFEVL